MFERIIFMVLKFIKDAFARASVIFTLICASYTLIVILADPSATEIRLDGTRVILFFVASVIFGLANLLRSTSKLSAALRQVIHFALYMFAFFTCCVLPLKLEPQTTVVGMAVFAIGYAVVMGVFLLVSSALKSKSSKNEEYAAQFKK